MRFRRLFANTSQCKLKQVKLKRGTESAFLQDASCWLSFDKKVASYPKRVYSHRGDTEDASPSQASPSQDRYDGYLHTSISILTTRAEPTAIMTAREPRTSGTLLRRVQRSDDQAAWSELVNRYSPMLERWTRAHFGNRVDVDEVSQRIWCELVHRLPGFNYDSKRSFRAWLKSLHKSRVLDYLKQQRRYRTHLVRFADQASESIVIGFAKPTSTPTATPTPNSNGSKLPQSNPTESSIDRILEIQNRVQDRVSAQTWELFWQVTIENQTVGDVARAHSMRYASVFAAVSRVNKMLRAESGQSKSSQDMADTGTDSGAGP